MGRAPSSSKDAGLNRGAWTSQEDSSLTKYISIHGDGGWKYLPKKAGLKRCGKSCRLRWLNYLRPDIKRGNISADEEELIIRMHKLLGNRWSLIAGRRPGRTDNEIKNYWKTQLVKNLEIKENIPPTTKEIHGISTSECACWEDNKVLRPVAVRSVVRVGNEANKKDANINSGHQEIKLQREVLESFDDLSENVHWCKSFVDEPMTSSDFEIVEYISPHNTRGISESPHMDIIGQPTFLSSLVDNQFRDCLNERENEVNTCNTILHLNEMCSPEDNCPWAPYNFLTDEWITELSLFQEKEGWVQN